MNTILIGYDLNRPGQHYDALIDGIKELGAWWHQLDSTWLVKTDLNAADVRDRLWALMDSGDEILVIDVTGRPWAANGFESYDWLYNSL
ncbi:MAG: hypothetical protein QOI31_1757 [Solirubrobacterales bacterium]|jgi:hypothetical protein|nr:hypothetical protein [Solirubrobacterales bacterium]